MGKGCRFTDDECANLHSKTGLPPILKDGKPTWGALADHSPAQNPFHSHAGAAGAGDSEYKPGRPQKTCWYWAHETCNNSAETCKYLHGYCAGGVAPKPSNNGWKKNWSRWDASGRPNLDDGSSVAGGGDGYGSRWVTSELREEGGLVLQVVEEEVSGSGGWGAAGEQPAACGPGGIMDGPWKLTENAASTWGEAAVDKYKPPHIKALEEQAQMAAVGW